DGVEVEPGAEAADGAEVHGEEVEEERALGLGGGRDQLPLRGGGDLLVDVLEVGRLAAQARAVVDDLAVDLARRVVDQRHGRDAPQLPKSLSSSSSASPRNAESTCDASCAGSRSNIAVKMAVRSVTAAFMRSFTSPSVVRLSKRTTRITRRAM